MSPTASARASGLTIAFVILALSTPGEARQTAAGPPGREMLPPGTGAISGRVVEAQSGQPLANVGVLLAELKGRTGAQTTTDTEGFYHFGQLPESDYAVHVVDPLYRRACYGATDVAQLQCGPIAVIRDQTRTGIDLRVVLGAVLRGRVVDVDGRAVSGATVRTTIDPSRPAVAIPSAADTKPDGTFELLNLPSGDVVLSLDMPLTADMPRAPTVFYPGVVSREDAEAIRVTEGLVTSDITFRFFKVANRSLTTRISTPAAGATEVRAYLYRVEPRMRREIVLDADHAGNVRGLLEGRYYVAAQAHQDGEALVAYEVADVVHDAVEVALLLTEPGRIAGKVIAERGSPPPLTDLRVAANWINDDGEEIDPVSISEVELAPDGSFRFDVVFGLRRVMLLGLPPEWRVQSIRQGRHEIATTGVTVASGATLDIVIVIGPR